MFKPLYCQQWSKAYTFVVPRQEFVLYTKEDHSLKQFSRFSHVIVCFPYCSSQIRKHDIWTCSLCMKIFVGDEIGINISLM